MLQLRLSQAQRVSHDRHRTKAHGCACDDGAEQDAKERIKHACGNGHPEHVVDKGEEKVLSDIPHHAGFPLKAA